MTRNEIILGVVALILVLFSLVVALVLPRRNPRFPGRHLRAFVLVSALLVVAMLASVEVFGAEHETEEGQAEEATTTETTTGGDTGETTTEGGEAQGDPAAGKEVFTSAGCTTCHTLSAAGSTGQTGPDLDEALSGKDAAFIRESIVDPDAQIAEGFSQDLMPETYGEELSDEELANLVAFLAQSTSG